MKEKVTLLIDADDTLWHNNIYYEQAIADFIEIMTELGFNRTVIEKEVRKREVENIRHHGYGSVCFTITMLEVYKETCDKSKLTTDEDIIKRIGENGKRTRDYDIDLLPGVEETLSVLSDKCTLIIVTKGCTNEQMAKIERSGLQKYFHDIIIVSEKDPEVYGSIINKHGLDPDKTWMIGNSARSDINPAKAAGLRTAYIPYHATWEFENEDISEQGYETAILEDFSEILNCVYGNIQNPVR
jgi:putative hydrolase of the HAD superfamily